MGVVARKKSAKAGYHVTGAAGSIDNASSTARAAPYLVTSTGQWFYGLTRNHTDWTNLSASGEDTNVAEILERSKNMEKLLRYHVRGISLDTDSLRRMAGTVPKANPSNSSHEEQMPNMDTMTSQDPFSETEDLALDENITVQPLAHNATRPFRH